ncbi:MAG: ester cyclase [Erythrobacter sp.]
MKQVIDREFVADFLKRLHAAANAHDAAAIAGLCSPDVIWRDPAAPAPLCGRDEVYRFHQETMFRALPDVRIELIDGPYLALDGTGAAARLRITGTMTGPLVPPGFAPTGGALEFETAEFSQFDEGLLSHHVVILDMLGLAQQIGAVPAPGGLGEKFGMWGQHLAALLSRSRRIER